MATVTIPAQREPALAATDSVWWVSCVMIALAMFAMEHDLRVSQYEGYVRNNETIEATAGGGNLARRAASLLLAGAGLFLLAWGHSQSLRLNLLVAMPLLAGLGWCLLSVLWSVDAAMCIRRLVVLACYVIGAAGLARSGSPQRVAKFCVWLALGSLALGVLTEVLLGTFRPWSGGYRFAGSLHPNAQGAYLATGAIAAWMLIAVDTPNRRRWLACFLLLTCFVALTKSRTSLAGLLLAVACVWGLRTSLAFKVTSGLAATWVAAVALLVSLFVGFDPQNAFVDALLLGRKEQAESLTGRSEIWEEVTNYISKQTWTGYGYESFWTEDHIRRISDSINFTILSAHSGYFELVLSVGVIGLIIFLGTLGIASLQAGWRLTRRPGGAHAFTLGMILFTVVCSFMESTMVTPNCSSLFLGVALLQLAAFAPEMSRYDPHRSESASQPA